jgi:mitogen-activated protein kinase kinase kinase
MVDMSGESSSRGVRFSDAASDHIPPELPIQPGLDGTSAPDLTRNGSGGTTSSSGSDAMKHNSSDDDVEGQFNFTPAVVPTPELDDIPPTLTTSYSWMGSNQVVGRGMSVGNDGVPEASPAAAGVARAVRPAPVRTPSNAYAPYAARRPTQYSLNSSNGRPRNSSTTRTRRGANPNAEYRAQEKAYVQRIRQDAADADDFIANDLRTPSLDFSSDSNTDIESPSTADHFDDLYEQETLLYYGNDEMQPSVEEMKVPENRERLEWHSMLAVVLTGDVVKQEKKRLIGGGEQQTAEALKAEIWLGLKAKCCGRSLQAHRRMVEKGRSELSVLIENIIGFEIQGHSEAGKSAAQQVADVVKKIETCDGLYHTTASLRSAHPRAGSPEYLVAYDAIMSWHNTMQMINTELAILRNWVGNDELDFALQGGRDTSDGRISEESSFIERTLKEDGLKSLQAKDSLLLGLNKVIAKAKKTLIANADTFSARHLPPYIEELQTLINFPSRLVKEIIHMRLSYAKKVKDLAQQGVMTSEQMIAQFQILLTLAVKIKEVYNIISRPEPGWEPPDCIEENFDVVVLGAFKFYFKLLNWKLSANKNAFKEAEILEQEWEFSNRVGRYLFGGDVEVAEQFRYEVFLDVLSNID